MSLIITITSIPSRFEALGETLSSLLKQNALIEDIQLYIPKVYKRFPDYDGSIPEFPSRINVIRPDSDYGPASKVLHAIESYKDRPNQPILFCDDDKIFAPDWASQIVKASEKFSDCAICPAGYNITAPDFDPPYFHSLRRPVAIRTKRKSDWSYRFARVKQMLAERRLNIPEEERPARAKFRKSGYVDIFEGYGGVLVRPSFFDPIVFTIPPEGRNVDDVWLSANVTKNGYGIWGHRQLLPKNSSNSHTDGLYFQIFNNKKRRQLDTDCVRYAQENFGIWKS